MKALTELREAIEEAPDIGGYAGKTIGAEGWSYGLSVGIAIE